MESIFSSWGSLRLLTDGPSRTVRLTRGKIWEVFEFDSVVASHAGPAKRQDDGRRTKHTTRNAKLEDLCQLLAAWLRRATGRRASGERVFARPRAMCLGRKRLQSPDAKRVPWPAGDTGRPTGT